MRLDTIKCDVCPYKAQWIPITKGQPRDKGRYLVTTVSGRVQELNYEMPCEFWANKVKAYMPLPEAYTE